MGVPTDENTDFDMFGTGSNTTIQGAINEGYTSGGNDAANGLTKFTQLISAASANLFDSLFAGVITNTNQVTKSSQFRGYPVSDSSNNSGLSSYFGSGNLIGHYGTTNFSTLSWRVNLQINGYQEKNVIIGPNTSCLSGCAYTSASRVDDANNIDGAGTITVTRLADGDGSGNTDVNDDGDVTLSLSGGTVGHNGGTSNTDGNPIRSLNDTRGTYTFSQGDPFSKTFSISGMLVADGDTFQLDITEG